MDISPTLLGKGTQLNADDLMGGDKIITITNVALANSPDQPLHINYEGDGGKPYKPCVSMRRVIAHMWGTDGSVYKGRKLRLFRDESVVFGGEQVGGIRINGASHITEQVTCKITARRGKKATIKIAPLVSHKTQGPSLADVEKKVIAAIGQKTTVDALEAMTGGDRYKRFMSAARKDSPDIAERVAACVTQRIEELSSVEADAWEELPS